MLQSLWLQLQPLQNLSRQRLTATVEGGELVAFGSAQPCTRERFDTGVYTTYYGLAQAVIRASEPGEVTLTLHASDGLTGQTFIQVH